MSIDYTKQQWASSNINSDNGNYQLKGMELAKGICAYQKEVMLREGKLWTNMHEISCFPAMNGQVLNDIQMGLGPLKKTCKKDLLFREKCETVPYDNNAINETLSRVGSFWKAILDWSKFEKYTSKEYQQIAQDYQKHNIETDPEGVNNPDGTNIGGECREGAEYCVLNDPDSIYYRPPNESDIGAGDDIPDGQGDTETTNAGVYVVIGVGLLFVSVFIMYKMA